jgi:hypothetical protein
LSQIVAAAAEMRRLSAAFFDRAPHFKASAITLITSHPVSPLYIIILWLTRRPNATVCIRHYVRSIIDITCADATLYLVLGRLVTNLVSYDVRFSPDMTCGNRTSPLGDYEAKPIHRKCSVVSSCVFVHN